MVWDLLTARGAPVGPRTDEGRGMREGDTTEGGNKGTKKRRDARRNGRMREGGSEGGGREEQNERRNEGRRAGMKQSGNAGRNEGTKQVTKQVTKERKKEQTKEGKTARRNEGTEERVLRASGAHLRRGEPVLHDDAADDGVRLAGLDHLLDGLRRRQVDDHRRLHLGADPVRAAQRQLLHLLRDTTVYVHRY